KNIVPICSLDNPLGLLASDVRVYSLQSAKEKGAEEVEISAPYHLIKSKDFKAIAEDAQNLMNASVKYKIKLRYILDTSKGLDDSIKSKLYNILATAKIPCIVNTYEGIDDKKCANDILNLRHIKKKIGCKTK